MTASQLAKQANISRTSVYDLIEKLLDQGLILESIKSGVKTFAVQPPEKLKLLLDDKNKQLLSAQKSLTDLEKIYRLQNKSAKPQMQLFEGREQLQQMMKDMLLYRNMTVYAYWPIKRMIDLLTPEFLTKFHKERVERNIKIKVIWPEKYTPLLKKYSFLKIKPEYKRQLRIAPAKIDFSLGYAVYGDTVRFISSSKENFGFLVDSPELSQMMKSQFDLIWNISKKV